MIRLFIENTEIELTQLVDFAITKLWEDLTNPTVIINDWSKTIDIPFSKKNNTTFGNIFLADRLIVKDASIANYVGLYFDPMRKLDFRLEYNDSVVMTGYAKMNRVNKKDGSGTYNITLNGTLGKVLQEMQKITFDDLKYTDAEDIRKYYISPSDSFGSAKITKNLVNTCWSNAAPNPQTYPSLLWIGFAPNNSFNDNFDYGSFQHLNTTTNEMEILKLTDVLNNTPAWQALHIDAGAVIDKGVLPKDFGEYRSYLQLPYIKFKKLFELFENKTLSATGYSIVKDSSWFNNSNPLWNNEVMMLKPFKQTKDLTTNVYSLAIDTTQKGLLPFNTQYTMNVKCNNAAETKSLMTSSNPFTFNTGNYLLRHKGTLDFTLKLKANTYVMSTSGVLFNDNCGIAIDVMFVDSVTNAQVYKYTLLLRERDEFTTINDLNYIGNSTDYKIITDFMSIGQTEATKHYTIDYSSFIANRTNPIKVLFKYKYILENTISHSSLFVGISDYSEMHLVQVNDFNFTMSFSNEDLFTINSDIRSNAKFTLNDLWNNDYSIYNIIMNYCKMHRILILVDDNSKTVNFIPAWKFFQHYTIEDWTDKIDMTHDYLIIVPCSFDNKYVLFNYKDNETKLGKDYLDKFGFKFGEMNLVTDYNFNTETKNLFDKPISTSIVYSDNNLSWNDLINGKIRYVVPQDIIIYSRDDDGKYVDNFGAFYLFRGLTSFDANPSFNFRSAKISDDTDVMLNNNTFCYNLISAEVISVTRYPLLDIIYNNLMCIANKPSLNYTYNGSSYNNAQGIYQKYWSNYLSERYYSGNKKITCYLWIKPEDFIQFKFNKFVKIENQLYFVNKIYDYSLNENVTTKVDLISVNDISKYYRIN